MEQENILNRESNYFTVMKYSVYIPLVSNYRLCKLTDILDMRGMRAVLSVILMVLLDDKRYDLVTINRTLGSQ